MDERSFQQELAQLKQRVAQMAATYQSSSAITVVGGDSFATELSEAKAHLNTIQASMTANDQARCDPYGPYSSPQQLPHRSLWDFTPHAPSVLPHHSLNLPSAPLFWSLFNSLRSDMRSLDTRVNDLERNVSNLEDRVDHALDPWTPTASTTDVPTSPWANHYGSTLSQPRAGPEDRSTYPYFAAPASNTVHGHVRQSPSELDASHANVQQSSTIWQKLTRTENAFAGPQQETFAQATSAPQGVAFRDKEIADLEELMRTTQDSLRYCEQASHRKDRQLAELKQKLTNCEAKLVDVLVENQGANEACRCKDAALQSLSSTHHRQQTQLSDATRELQRLQHALHEALDDRQDHMDEIINAKENAILNLRMLCESKQAVVVQQEQVIARGVDLMEEKDNELERLSCELAALKFKSENESRMAGKKEEVIAQLRTSLNHALLTPANTAQKAFATPILHASRDSIWTPKPFKSAPLPNERKRAAIWKNGSRSTSLTFGKSGFEDSCELGGISSPREALKDEDTLDQSKEKRPISRKRPQSQQLSYAERYPVAAVPPLPPRNQDSLADSRSTQQTRQPPERKLHSYVEPDEEEDSTIRVAE